MGPRRRCYRGTVKRPSPALGLFAYVLGATVAACSGQGTTSPGPVDCPQFIAVYTATLVQPPNGAAGVSTTLGTIVATTNPFNTQGLGGNNVTLLVNGNLAIEGGVFTPISSPSSSPSYSATIPTLAAHTTYQVSATVPPPSPGPCPLRASWNIGSFTTR